MAKLPPKPPRNSPSAHRTPKEAGDLGEREVAKILERATGHPWRATPRSGGMRLDFPFDLMPEGRHEDSVLDGVGIEVKNTTSISMPQWIQQVEETTEDYRGNPYYYKWLLFFKYESKWYTTIRAEYLQDFIRDVAKGVD